MTWSRKQRAKRRASLDAVRRVMRNEAPGRSRHWPRPEDHHIVVVLGRTLERAETDLAVATHLLHEWNDHHRADPEDWAAAARLRGTVQETAKFLGAELGVAA